MLANVSIQYTNLYRRHTLSISLTLASMVADVLRGVFLAWLLLRRYQLPVAGRDKDMAVAIKGDPGTKVKGSLTPGIGNENILHVRETSAIKPATGRGQGSLGPIIIGFCVSEIHQLVGFEIRVEYHVQ